MWLSRLHTNNTPLNSSVSPVNQLQPLSLAHHSASLLRSFSSLLFLLLLLLVISLRKYKHPKNISRLFIGWDNSVLAATINRTFVPYLSQALDLCPGLQYLVSSTLIVIFPSSLGSSYCMFSVTSSIWQKNLSFHHIHLPAQQNLNSLFVITFLSSFTLKSMSIRFSSKPFDSHLSCWAQ